jgi:hypothetical protein
MTSFTSDKSNLTEKPKSQTVEDVVHDYLRDKISPAEYGNAIRETTRQLEQTLTSSQPPKRRILRIIRRG